MNIYCCNSFCGGMWGSGCYSGICCSDEGVVYEVVVVVLVNVVVVVVVMKV